MFQNKHVVKAIAIMRLVSTIRAFETIDGAVHNQALVHYTTLLDDISHGWINPIKEFNRTDGISPVVEKQTVW